MKKLFLYTSLAALLMLSSSCGGGFLNSSQLAISGGGDLFITFGVH